MTREQLQRLARVRQWTTTGRAKAIRQGARMSMVELGEQISVADGTISRWEAGQRTPSGDPGLRYAEALEALVEVTGMGDCETCEEGDGLAVGHSQPTGKSPTTLAEHFPHLMREAMASQHGDFSGTHAHAHSPYGQQGGDETHDHSHSHSGDNRHDHNHLSNTGETLGRRPDMMTAGGSFRADPDPADTAAGLKRAAWNAQLRYGITASGEPADLMAGQHWNVREVAGEGWYANPPAILLADTGRWHAEWKNPAGSYAEALAKVADQMAQERPGTLTDTWRSEMAFEGRPTGDGRFIEVGAIEYRATPLPLMLQTTTEQGHYGAVLCGSITATGKLGTTAVGSGDFDASDAGRQAQSIIAARGRFGVSIDVAEAEGEPVCADHGSNLEECDLGCDWEAHFTLIRVMGLTLTPFPAFEDAYIELVAAPEQNAPVAASGEPAANEDGGDGTGGGVEYETDLDQPADMPIVAAARPDGPLSIPAPADWFRPPPWKPGDRHLVRQPSGGYACPLTVDPPDPAHGNLRRVYGHVADRLTCHTGIRDRCQLVPRSRSGYAAFNLRPLMTGDGQVIKVGHLTMGTGHASTSPHMSADQVRGHYDGGPGAVRMSYVAAGDDEYGPWVAGVIVPERSGEQIRDFAACSLSGDWREVWRGRGQELVAVLAGVTVPGFPIAAAALTAAGVHVPQVPEIGPAKAGWRDNEIVALVAAGVVRQPMPWERQLAHLEQEMQAVRDLYRRVELTMKPLFPIVVALMQAEAAGFNAPTKADASVMAALVRAKSALHDAQVSQGRDPDQDDADDHKVTAGVGNALAVLDKVIADQARDGTPDEPPDVAGVTTTPAQKPS